MKPVVHVATALYVLSRAWQMFVMLLPPDLSMSYRRNIRTRAALEIDDSSGKAPAVSHDPLERGLPPYASSSQSPTAASRQSSQSDEQDASKCRRHVSIPETAQACRAETHDG